jgi:hypothetical protein
MPGDAQSSDLSSIALIRKEWKRFSHNCYLIGAAGLNLAQPSPESQLCPVADEEVRIP